MRPTEQNKQAAFYTFESREILLVEIGFKLEFIKKKKKLFRFTIPRIMPKQKQFVNYSPVELIYFNNKKKNKKNPLVLC